MTEEETEGKLYRELQKRYTQIQIDADWPEWEDESEGGKAILDEAKADFPRAIFPDDAGPEYFQTAKDLLADIQKWHYKWLGTPT